MSTSEQPKVFIDKNGGEHQATKSVVEGMDTLNMTFLQALELLFKGHRLARPKTDEEKYDRVVFIRPMPLTRHTETLNFPTLFASDGKPTSFTHADTIGVWSVCNVPLHHPV